MRLFLKWLYIALAVSLLDANGIPQNALKAEMQERWYDAVEAYEKVIKSDPTRVDIYLRLGDIYYKVKDYDSAAASISKALEYDPENALLHSKLSKIYAVQNRPDLALISIKKAIELDSNNTDYLNDQASLANWNTDYELAVNSYKKLLEKTKDERLLMQIAKTNAWSGQLDDAAEKFKEYLSKYPEDKETYIHYIRTEIWRGNYPNAEKLVSEYINRFGNDDEIQTIRADLYARAEWPDMSHNLYEPLLVKKPEDYILNYIKTLALYHDQRPSEAIESLEKVKKIQPDSKDTMDLSRFILTKYRSNIMAEGVFYEDIAHIEHTVLGVYARHYIEPETSVFIGTEYDTLRSESTSVYKNIDGSKSSEVARVGIGGSHRFNQHVEAEVLVGNAESTQQSTVFARANVRVDINDKATLFLEGSHDFYMISPLSSSLGVERTHSGALLEYRPTLSTTILAQAEYDLFSSSNSRWSLLLAPRTACVRSEKWSLDLGVRLWNFGFDKDLNQGYYDPDRFESYMATFYANYRFNADDELFVMGGAGIVKDDAMGSYKFGNNIDVVGTVGIYQDWKLQAKAGYMNNRNESVVGYYDSYYVGLSVVRRF